MTRILTLTLLLVAMSFSAFPQNGFDTMLSERYDAYREGTLNHQRVRHADVVRLLGELRQDSRFETKLLGQSVEGRDIFLVKLGTGKTKVLLWSQMHGDEGTATLALFDIFNFFRQKDEMDPLKKELLEGLTLYFIPMLNPDGAEAFKRRNALDIDMNRDALRLASPESRILKQVRDSLNPEFGFNLHDQGRLYAAGKGSAKPAVISFLAPAFNEAKDINPVRERALKLIVTLNNMLQSHIPGMVGRYNDDFEPRAFGDNIQKWGTSVVLVESGGYPGDPEKQEIRKFNFMLLLYGFQAIVNGKYSQEPLAAYSDIPENHWGGLAYLIVRNAKVMVGGRPYTMDIGVNHTYLHEGEAPAFRFVGSISELGDMSVFHGYDEIDAEGLTSVPGKTWGETLPDIGAVRKLDAAALLREGYTTVPVAVRPDESRYLDIPLNLTGPGKTPDYSIELGRRANFTLQKDGKAVFAVVNGFVYDLATGKHNIANTLYE